MSKELSGGPNHESGVFSLFRNLDRYNDDNFKLSQTPPGELKSMLNVPARKSKITTLKEENKDAVIIHTSGPAVRGFYSVLPAQINTSSDPTKSIDGIVSRAPVSPRHNPVISQVITGEVFRSNISPSSPEILTKSEVEASSPRKPASDVSAPHGSLTSSPSSESMVKLYEKAVSQTSRSQPSSPKSIRKFVRNSSMENFEKFINIEKHQEKGLVKLGDSQVVSRSEAATRHEHSRMFPVPEHATESDESAFSQSKPSGFGQWLWGKDSKIKVQDRELNFISPTSF